MNKKASLIISLSITVLLVGNYIFFSEDPVVRERVEISRILDGDTIELTDERRIRLLNINTPEKGYPYSDLGKDFLSEFKEVELESVGVDRYNRILGRIYYNEVYLNLEIVEEGMAHSYLVDSSEFRLFEKAELFAKNNEKGIWKKSEHYGCLEVEINKYDEYLVIEDLCDLNLESWTIKDESTKSYKFTKDVSEEFTLFSAKGIDSEKELYWGRENVWNDDHDEIFIRDSNGLLVYYHSYS